MAIRGLPTRCCCSNPGGHRNCRCEILHLKPRGPHESNGFFQYCPRSKDNNQPRYEHGYSRFLPKFFRHTNLTNMRKTPCRVLREAVVTTHLNHQIDRSPSERTHMKKAAARHRVWKVVTSMEDCRSSDELRFFRLSLSLYINTQWPSLHIIQINLNRSQKMWKFLENSIKHLSNPYVAIAVVAVTPWLVLAFLGAPS